MIYLNNAAGSWPKAPGVADAMLAALQECPGSPGRASGVCGDAATDCRGLLARLLSVQDPSRIVLTTSGTHALNLALWGLRPNKPLRAITSVLDHNSVLRPLHHIVDRHGGRVDPIPLRRGVLDEEAFSRALQRGADVVVLTHASNVSGEVLDVAPKLRAARQAGAVAVLDASQTAGLLDLAPEGLGADLIAFAGHKALHGPPGTGALWVRDGIELGPLMVGGTGVLSESRLHPSAMPMRLEAGTPNEVALAGWRAALKWALASGSRARITALRNHLLGGLSATAGVRIAVGSPDADNVGIVSLQLRGWSPEDAAYALRESFGIVTRPGLHCAPLAHEALGTAPLGTLRLSLSSFNTEPELDAAIEAVRRLVR